MAQRIKEKAIELQVKAAPETAYLSNGIILADYDSRDPIITELVRKTSSLFSELLTMDNNDLFGNAVEYKPFIIDYRDYGTKKEYLFEKAKKLHDACIHATREIPTPSGKKLSVNGYYHLFSVCEDVKNTPYIKLTVDKDVIPVLRYIGQAQDNSQIGMTKLNLFKLKQLKGSYTSRIAELVEYLQQNFIPRGNVIGTIAIDEFMKRLRIPESYRRPARLRRNILDPSLKELLEKHRLGISVEFLNAEEKPCVCQMKSEYIQFSIYYKPDSKYLDQDIYMVSSSMKNLGFEEEEITNAMYLMRKPKIKKALTEQMKFLMKNNPNNPLLIKNAFAKSIKDVSKMNID